MDNEPDREWSNEDLDQDTQSEREQRRLAEYDNDIDGYNEDGDFEGENTSDNIEERIHAHESVDDVSDAEIDLDDKSGESTDIANEYDEETDAA